MSKPGAKRRNEFPADRITIMISANLHAKINLVLANDIKQCAKDNCDLPSTSYSRIINKLLNESFSKNHDKVIILKAKKDNP